MISVVKYHLRLKLNITVIELGTGQEVVMLCGWEGNRRPCGK